MSTFRASEIYGRDHSGPALDASSGDTYGRDHPIPAPEVLSALHRLQASSSDTHGSDLPSPALEASSSDAYGHDNTNLAPEASPFAGVAPPGSWDSTEGSGKDAESASQESAWATPRHVPPPPGAVDWGATATTTGVHVPPPPGAVNGKGTTDKGAQATPTTITVQGQGLSAAGQHVISDACHKVAIAGGFSVPDQITVKHHSSADVVFPHLSAAMEFFQATNGGLWIGGNLFHVRPPRGQAQAETSTRPQQDAHNGETPTDTLVVRGIGDMTTRQLGDAFAHLTPRLKRVNIPTDKAGKSRGLGWVTFFEIEEAELVYQRLKREGCMLSGRRVSVKFHEPDTIEGMVELQALKKRSLESIEASHTQALKGPNADMWKSYLAMFQQPAPEEPKPKHAKSEAFNATMPDLQTERAEEFPSGMGNMGGSMPPLFPMPTNLGGGGGGWLGLT